MFTGIIQDIGNVVRIRQLKGDLRLCVRLDQISPDDIALGDSVAVNGACLTVVNIDGAELDFDVSKESLANTNIAAWTTGTGVNLELALLPTTRLGGHLVSGHVDGLATITRIEEDARSRRIEFECPQMLRRFIARKGSVTIDGISLTINDISDTGFGVNIVPHTLQVTTLGMRSEGDRVHIEVDQIARYLEQLLISGEAGRDGLKDESIREKLVSSGFIR